MIIYEDERFFILDTGSSNGTFVNNIRLSKTGEESKMTEIFTGDIIRFGSDIVDKVILPLFWRFEKKNYECLSMHAKKYFYESGHKYVQIPGKFVNFVF